MNTRKKRYMLPIVAVLVLSFALNITLPAFAVEYGAELNPSEKAYSQSFSDVPESHWAFQYIEEMKERGAINGYPDGKFYPNKIVTREEFAKIMVVAAGLTATPARTSSYADVPTKYWSSPFIETAKPYMTAYQGAGGLYFKPTDGALREDMAVAVVMLKGYDARLADLSMINTMFSDVNAISAGAQPYVALAIENGIISGYQDGTFRGQATITRAEAAAILWRAFQYGSDSKVMPGEKLAPTQTGAASGPGTTTKPTEALPPEPEKEVKPFIAETLTKADISDTIQHMTMDDDGNLIYYDRSEKAILSLDPESGEIETLLDVAAASDELSIRDGYAVRQIFWDDMASRLLVAGLLQATQPEDGWESGSETGFSSAIFTLENGQLEKLFVQPRTYYMRIALALENGEYICREGYRAYICDLSKNEEYAYNKKDIGGDFHYGKERMGISNRTIYSTNSGYLMQYDYGTNGWTKVSETYYSGFFRGAADYQNGYFYTWGDTTIQIVRLSDGAHQTKLTLAEDVEVLDMRPLPSSQDNLFATGDEQYLFYDSTAKAIRVIRANPEAE